MSSIINTNAASIALPTVTFPPHGRGHGKKGSDLTGITAASTGAAAPIATSPAVTQELSGFVHSLFQVLQQGGSAGATTPAISNLESSFNSLIQGVSGGTAPAASTAGAGGATSAASTASLQNFLNNVLQNLQANGSQIPNLSGSNVNARV